MLNGLSGYSGNKFDSIAFRFPILVYFLFIVEYQNELEKYKADTYFKYYLVEIIIGIELYRFRGVVIN